ncbi:MAG TPA: SIMPL domain-containing protein [Ignavibacteriaceae bacterium]|nr:SIMPL domain-containing protein [Ignavibacteriaceae bacterium]
MENRNTIVISVLILGLSFIIGVIIFTTTWKSNQTANQTITVTGSAKKDIVSDFGVLQGSISIQGSDAQAAYRELLRQKPIVLSYLNSKGFDNNKVELSTVNTNPIYQIVDGMQTNNIVGYVCTQTFKIVSNDVYKIKEISLDIANLIEKGVNFNTFPPEYHYLKLGELKIEIQAAAAKDAMIRAQKIAEATDRDLGPMRTARMGVLQITPKFSNQISDYGVNDLSSIEKEITAVVNASFEIE